MDKDHSSAFAGLMIGTALGDSLGLPMEGLGPRRVARLFPGPLRQRLIAGRGMVSDDTDHTFFVAQCLLAHPDDENKFVRRLGWCLRGWLLSLPPGVGWATLRSVLKLWLGISPTRSGVFSAGNGPAMRSPVIGAALAFQPKTMRRFVRASTRLTHTDPKAEVGALAAAQMAAKIMTQQQPSRPEVSWLLQFFDSAGSDVEWLQIRSSILESAHRDEPVDSFAARLGLDQGVTGYIYHSVPVALYAVWKHWNDFPTTLDTVVRLGGDTDTVAALAGALAGLQVGEEALPKDWTAGIWDPFRGVARLRNVGFRLAELREGASRPVNWLWFLHPIRHASQLLVILIHGFRRLAPPYS